MAVNAVRNIYEDRMTIIRGIQLRPDEGHNLNRLKKNEAKVSSRCKQATKDVGVK